MDYKELLKWYINYIGEVEGTDFVSNTSGDENWEELKRVKTEIFPGWKEGNYRTVASKGIGG